MFFVQGFAYYLRFYGYILKTMRGERTHKAHNKINK